MELVRATTTGPPDAAGLVPVTVDSFDPDQALGPCSFTPLGAAVPTGGEPCWVAFDDDGDAVIVWWEPLIPAAWHVVADAGEPAFDNGWGHFDVNRPAKFRKDSMGVVRLAGYASAGTVGNGVAIFTLRAGFRPVTGSPTGSYRWPVVSNTAFGVVQVFPDGRLCLEAGSNTWVCLAGISFLAEA